MITANNRVWVLNLFRRSADKPRDDKRVSASNFTGYPSSCLVIGVLAWYVKVPSALHLLLRQS
jgi:hypothetical protein